MSTPTFEPVSTERIQQIASDAKEANVAESRNMAIELAVIRQCPTYVDLKRQLDIAERQAKAMAQAADTEKAEAAVWKGAVIAVLGALKDPPLGFHNDKVVLHRSTTEADVIEWLRKVYEHLKGASSLLRSSMEHPLIASFSDDDLKEIRRLLDCAVNRIEDDLEDPKLYGSPGFLLLKKLTGWPKLGEDR